MSELSNIFGGGAEHAHEQQAREKILPAPAPISGDGLGGEAKVEGVSIPPIGLPGEAMNYEPFAADQPADDAEI